MTVHVHDEQDSVVDTERLGDLAALVLREEGLPETAEVSLTLVRDDVIAGYNQRYMGRSGPTDVLSFPLEDLRPGLAPTPPPGGPPLALGDVLVAPAQIRRQAEEHGVPFESELSLMVVHGLLHLLGYDHEEDSDAEVMEGRERHLLALVGVTRP